MTYESQENYRIVKIVRWTDGKGRPQGKRVTYEPNLYTETEIVAQVLRQHDPLDNPEGVTIETPNGRKRTL